LGTVLMLVFFCGASACLSVLSLGLPFWPVFDGDTVCLFAGLSTFVLSCLFVCLFGQSFDVGISVCLFVCLPFRWPACLLSCLFDVGLSASFVGLSCLLICLFDVGLSAC